MTRQAICWEALKANVDEVWNNNDPEDTDVKSRIVNKISDRVESNQGRKTKSHGGPHHLEQS